MVALSKACLHQASVSTLWQLSNDARDAVLIENNGVCSRFGFNENSITSIMAEFSRRWRWRPVYTGPNGRVYKFIYMA